MVREETGTKMTQRIWRMFWLLVLVGHGLLALTCWWLLPGGFGFGHSRFWSNRVAPPVVLGLSIASLVALRHDRIAALRLLLPAWPAAWVGGSIRLRILFPITMAGIWLVLLAIAAILAMAAFRPWRIPGERGWVGALLVAIGSALAGFGAAGTLRPPAPATHPRDIPLAPIALLSGASGRLPPGSIQFDSGAMVQTSDGSLIVRLAPLTISVQPLLTFLDQSSDGCPIVLVRTRDREGPELRFRDGRRVGERSYVLFYEFRGQGPATLRVNAGPEPGPIAVGAVTRLELPVDSHLNSFCDVEVRGHRRLFLEFSPCPGARIEVRPFDYPFGRPARFAFVQADRTFRVVEASNGEKGPFRTLARGRLEAERALTITFHDEERGVARLTLDDFAAQADTTLSPTAGWARRSMLSSSACRRTRPRPRHRCRSSSRWRRRRSAAAGIASAIGQGRTAIGFGWSPSRPHVGQAFQPDGTRRQAGKPDLLSCRRKYPVQIPDQCRQVHARRTQLPAVR